MKILKPGKVEMRKFVCPKCGCEFAVSKTEMVWTIYGLRKCCPTCYQNHDWDNGEPYEEPTHTQTDRERLAQLLVETTQFCNFGEKADYIIANGVTFREGLVYET